ncbi:hypothetical protein F0L17_11495 [Streptomyces sp. TRM43335]|uniref:Uncharacterized protein n=1 Tax=Streptomyces taklimakanensis TaxID=2569853 RepID=A0A6G2BBU3_9ACTN|nr:hypothetical protein [Streptomyces taklimakanensis]MTE19737.1 hypothetical protein [Streptomyces taklimakanensis]
MSATDGRKGRGERAERREPAPTVGAVARDLRDGRVGEVMDVLPGRIWLRPLGGGREWDAEPRQVESLTPREQLSARLAAANARSRHPLP